MVPWVSLYKSHVVLLIVQDLERSEMEQSGIHSFEILSHALWLLNFLLAGFCCACAPFCLCGSDSSFLYETTSSPWLKVLKCGSSLIFYAILNSQNWNFHISKSPFQNKRKKKKNGDIIVESSGSQPVTLLKNFDFIQNVFIVVEGARCTNLLIGICQTL